MTHVREHRSLLAGAEKRLLIHIAARLPAAVTSDHLTALALVAMVIAGASFTTLQATAWGAGLFVVALAVNWFGDSLDGTVARVRDQQRPRYGYYVDHVVDLAGTMALVAGMAASGLMSPAVAMALLAAYCLVSAESYLATHSLGVFRISFAGVGPTELRILLAVRALVVGSRALGHPGRPSHVVVRLRRDHRDRRVVRSVHRVFGSQRAALYLADPLPSAFQKERAA
jgi:phosphatidylglycerophosphate synthase